MIVLQTRIITLCHAAHQLQFLGFDGQPVYADSFSKLNIEVYRQSESLISKYGSTVEEEAALCVALLAGYRATLCNYGNKEAKIQTVLDRSARVLGQLSASLLKCKLLVACYGEVFEPELAEEAHIIIDSWIDRLLSVEEQEVVNQLQCLEEHLQFQNVTEYD